MLTQSSDCSRLSRVRLVGQALRSIARRGICPAPFVATKGHGLRVKSVNQMFGTKRSRPLSNVGHRCLILRIFQHVFLLTICS